MLALALAVLQEWIVALVAVAVFLVVLVSIRVASSNRRRETDRRSRSTTCAAEVREQREAA